VPTIRLDETIRATRERVFDAVADVPSQRAFNPLMKSAHVVTPGPVGVGTRVAVDVDGVGAIELVVVLYERPSHIAFESETPLAAIRHDFFVDATDAGTLLRQMVVFTPHGLARLASPGMGIVMRRRLRAVTRGLRDSIEQVPPA
jgi:hypothetical protein